MFEFDVISGSTIRTLIAARPARCIASVQASYLAHHDGLTVNPDSYFLRFPAAPANRIIALPASIEGDGGVAGIKWIASFPGNIERSIPRASAVLILNDQHTGYPFACMEASLISAARTAASAVLGAYWLNGRRRHGGTIAFIGAGIIARNILDMFVADHWEFDGVVIHDSHAGSMQAFAQHAAAGAQGAGCPVRTEAALERALEADIVVFATNAGVPYVLPPLSFGAGQIVLNISLRDLAPELILDADNVVDDIDHCLKAQTSPHLAELRSGNRDFVNATLAQLIRGDVTLDGTRARIFSPFGMGILDLGLGLELYHEARAQGATTSIDGFFGETARW